MTAVIFWGATGQARVLRDCLDPGQRLVAVFDNDPQVAPPFADVPLIAGWSGFERWRARQSGASPLFFVAVGGDRGRARMEIHRRLEAAGLAPAVARHRTAFVAASARVDAGCQILAQAAVCVEAMLGPGCIVNTAASVDHECVLEEGVHVAPGARLAGCVSVGAGSTIGAGAVVLPRLRVGRDSIVGAGAVVVRDVPDNTIVVGNPARILRERHEP